MTDIIVVTTNYVPNYKISKVLGTIWGLTVRSRGFGGNVAASFRTLIGGEVQTYVKLLNDARTTALERLKAEAKKIGANAIINMRFDSSEIGQVMTEIVAYGTAVVVEESKEEVQRVKLI